MPPNTFKLKETGDIFTFKNGKPILLQLGSLAGQVQGRNFGEKRPGITNVLRQYGVDYDKLPEISVEDAARRFMPGAHPNAFFDFAQPGTIQDLARGGEQIRTLSPQEISQAYQNRLQERRLAEYGPTGNLGQRTLGGDIAGIQSGVQSAADTLRTLSSQRGVALTPEFQQQFGGEQTQDQPGAGVGTDPFGELYETLKQYLDELQKRGQVINPNIELTPDKVAAFLSQAEKEIDPYYSTQLKLAKEGFLSSLGYTRDEILRQEEATEARYEQKLREIGEESAERGFALSGRRIQAESDLATETQDQIESTRRQFGFKAGEAARAVAQQYGTGAVPTFKIGQAPRVLPGEQAFARGGQELPLYELSPDVYQGLVGEKEFERRGAISSRASELEEAFRTTQSLGQQRQLLL